MPEQCFGQRPIEVVPVKVWVSSRAPKDTEAPDPVSGSAAPSGSGSIGLDTDLQGSSAVRIRGGARSADPLASTNGYNKLGKSLYIFNIYCDI